MTGKERRLLQHASLVIEMLARSAVAGKNPGTKQLSRTIATLQAIWEVAGVPGDSQAAIDMELADFSFLHRPRRRAMAKR